MTVLIEFFSYVGLHDLENPLCYLHFMLIKNDLLKKSLLGALYLHSHTTNQIYTLKMSVPGL